MIVLDRTPLTGYSRFLSKGNTVTDRTEEFKTRYREYLECMGTNQSRVCKDPKREYIVLLDGTKRISLNNKATWTAKSYAERAVKEYLLSKYGWNGPEHVWREIVQDYKAALPKHLDASAEEIRKTFAKRIQIITLMDYMVMQSRLSRNK